MDIKLPPRPWYKRYRYHLLGACLLIALIGYAIYVNLKPRTLRLHIDDDQIAVVVDTTFMEYTNIDGTATPISTLRINTAEGGIVEDVMCRSGDMVSRGDTILTLSNPSLIRQLEDERMQYEQKAMTYRRQIIEMQQRAITLRQQAMQAQYELSRLEKSFALEQEEAHMGMKSKAQLEVARDEYNYKTQSVRLTLESLSQDSVLNVISLGLIEQQMKIDQRQYQQQRERLSSLAVVAPADGQISELNVAIGQQLGSDQCIASLGILTSYKVTARMNEYYTDRITDGQPATVVLHGRTHKLHVSHTSRQVTNQGFDIELMFDHRPPDDLRPGATLRLQIELGKPGRALVVPRGTFYATTSGLWIMRLDPHHQHRAQRTPIRLGRQNPRWYEVVEGLTAGDRVVIGGYEQMGDAEVIEW